MSFGSSSPEPGRALRTALAAALTLLAPALAHPGSPGVDWEHRFVRCTGRGAPRLGESSGNVTVARARTERAARSEARRACLDVLGTLLVRSGESADALFGRDPTLKATVEAVLRRFSRTAVPRYFADGGAAIDLQVPLDGELTTALLDAVLPKVAGGGEAGTLAEAEGRGVLVDAADCPVLPALAPRLLDPEGRVVYDITMLGRDARASGGVAYLRGSLIPRGRIGDAPRVVRALRAEQANLVLSTADAESLRGNPALSAGRVAILLRGEAR